LILMYKTIGISNNACILFAVRAYQKQYNKTM